VRLVSHEELYTPLPFLTFTYYTQAHSYQSSSCFLAKTELTDSHAASVLLVHAEILHVSSCTHCHQIISRCNVSHFCYTVLSVLSTTFTQHMKHWVRPLLVKVFYSRVVLQPRYPHQLWKAYSNSSQTLTGISVRHLHVHTRNTLDCDQSNYSSRIVFSHISIEFGQTGISAIQSADPENRILEPKTE